ncbi:MAG: hypothetical protein COA84_15015 [Robiginitomaculum sp.]|nr:MAG: hypothetical protein COA84_15015 [Robiginitomaculum sp.]
MKTVTDAVNEFKGDISSIRKSNGYDTDRFLHRLDINTDFGSKGEGVLYSCKNANCTSTYLCTAKEFNQCVDEMSKAEWIKPVTPLTYTQAMADAGTLPSVGMEYKDGVVMVDADADGMYVVQEAGVSIICALSGITPVTPPIVLEDGKAYQFDYKQGVKVVNSMTGICILSGDIFLTVDGSFCIPNCTNIKLLGVTS